jgi:hypothetical protein
MRNLAISVISDLVCNILKQDSFPYNNSVFIIYLTCNTMCVRYIGQPVLIITPWPESVRELYRPSDHRMPTKLVPTFADRGASCVIAADPYDRNLCFLDRSSYLFFQIAPQLYSRD